MSASANEKESGRMRQIQYLNYFIPTFIHADFIL